MFDASTLLILIPALPLAAAIVTALLGRGPLRRHCWAPTVAALALSFGAAILLVFQLQEQIEHSSSDRAAATVVLWNWCDVAEAMPVPSAAGDLSPSPAAGNLHIDVVLRADSLTAVMLAVVTCISALVAVYSIGYMHGDSGGWRFFSYVSLFVFSMTMLVSVDNFVMLYVFWEAVGLCSYLLIGFWYDKPEAAAAGKKAFLVNRIGDVGFALGIFLIWTTFGTLDFDGAFASAGSLTGDWRLTAICLLLFVGACGKSAQLPLHVWLPDAMEGPTPVSALIHAATMVTAGVYMVARCGPLFAASVDAQYAVAAVGGATGLVAAAIALAQTDLKRILAYSTISHLGYMFVALGAGTAAAVTAGMFHLATHAFFKALLFLGAGSVMHATGGVLDIHRLGGLRRRMPVTYWTFLIGCLAIAGVVPLAGFWSKDAILLALADRAGESVGGELFGLLLTSALFGVLLIDFYMFRPFFLVFHGPERLETKGTGPCFRSTVSSLSEPDGRKMDQSPNLRHLHESPGTMTAPLVVLAFASATIGVYFEWAHGFDRFLAASPSVSCLAHAPVEAARGAETVSPQTMGLLSTFITLAGIAAAAAVYLGNRRKAERLARAMNVFGLYGLSYGKFFFDPIYTLLIVRPMLGVARAAAWFDRCAIDAAVDFCGRLPSLLGAAMRPAQNGLVPFYALAMALGLLAMLGALMM